MITVETIADSVNPVGVRLTTLKLEYPRYIHAQFMTHRVFARNASSSRAIPVKVLINKIKSNPVTPEEWRYVQRGMSPGKLMNEQDNAECSYLWDRALWTTIQIVEELEKIGAQKEIVNRLLEPFSHIQVLVSATDWNNFFSLRVHEDAQHEISVLAGAIQKRILEGTPQNLNAGEWHLPFIRETEKHIGLKTKIKISTARCARVSYYLHDGKETTVEADLKLYNRLVVSKPIHASPSEHPAEALNDNRRIRNFRGFRMFRDFIDTESLE